MKTAAEYRAMKKAYQATLQGELDRMEVVFNHYDPKWDKKDEKVFSVDSEHYYDIENFLKHHGFTINPVQAYGDEEIDVILEKNKSITVVATW